VVKTRFFLSPYRLRISAFGEIDLVQLSPFVTRSSITHQKPQKTKRYGPFSGPLCPKHPPMRWYKRLQQKWKVNSLQLALILITFAVGGSLTGQVARLIMDRIEPGEPWYWGLAYLLIVTALWPFMVLIISIPLGQFRFFQNYIAKLAGKLGLRKNP
jgi:hypothetical protein